MKNILLIGTGGTIASDVTEDGLAPELTTEQLLSHLPAISGICNVDCVQLLNLDSTNMRTELSHSGQSQAHHPHRRAEAHRL